MSDFKLQTPAGDSVIRIGVDVLSELKRYVDKKHPDSKVAVVTDANVGELYREQISAKLPGAMTLAIQPGEGSKRLESVKQLTENLLEAGLTRTDIIVGMGGGMITDLAGFVASVYMRGVKFISIPTSLLGMVDASIGGKTGVNLVAKNSLGTIYPAELILIDPNFLDTLPARDLKTGMAEVVKYALTLDASLLNDLSKTELDYVTIIEKSVGAKVAIVSQDVMETDVRKALNFGHTFGHAIEAHSGYNLTHGEAISIGMILANQVARKLERQTADVMPKTKELLERFGLPSEIPKGIKVEELAPLMMNDKKMSGNKLTFIIVPEIGKFETVEMGVEELIDLAA